MTPSIDQAALDHVRKLGDDRLLIDVVHKASNTTIPHNINALRTAAGTGNPHTLRSAAHTLSVLAGNVGAVEMGQIARSIESTGLSSNDLREMISRLEATALSATHLLTKTSA